MSAPGLTASLKRFRVLALLVGTGLLVLVFVAMPLRYLGDRPAFSHAFSPLHGFVFLVYLAAVADLGRRARWSLRRMVLVMLAGTVPFLSFVVERRVSSELGQPAAA